MSESIRAQAAEGVLDLEIARAEKKNALTTDMYTALADALDRATSDDGTRVVILRGSDSCFTAGNDLKDFLEHPPTGFDSPVFRFIKAASVFPKPLLVAVEGVAVGIGTTLLLHADLAVAGSGATFLMPFVNLGLCPEAASSLLLPRMVGHAAASRWLLLGESFGAEEAKAAGLVNEVVDAGDAAARVREWAATLALKPPAAVRLSKALLRRPVEGEIAAAIEAEGRAFIDRLDSDEAKEALTAFFEKRPPTSAGFPDMTFRQDYLTEAVNGFRAYKTLADNALSQVDDAEFFASPGPETNSIAIVVKHMAGNMRSRWTDFLTTDGEKPDRQRDTEFELLGASREALMDAWERGWATLFAALEPLTEDDLDRSVTIRGKPHTLLKAINRQLLHYSYHVGQIVLLARHAAGPSWTTLSVPRGGSEAHNADMRETYGDWTEGKA